MSDRIEQKLNPFAIECLNIAKKMHKSDITQDIKNLWKSLTTDRRTGIHDYFQKASARRAYVGYYFPMYVAKIGLLLERLDREGHFESYSGKPVNIWDLGSGTLTGITALKMFFENRPFRALAVDKSLAPMRMALDVLRDTFSSNVSREITIRQGNLLAPTGSYLPQWSPNFIFLGHVINELGEGPRGLPRKMKFVSDLLGRLEVGGYMLIVEPATQHSTRDLMVLRDYLENQDEYEILAPCTGASECPLLKSRASWCFSELKWNRPAIFKSLDDSIGFERESLKTSYLLISKKKKGPETKRGLRVVSGPMISAGINRRYICTSLGLRTLQTKVDSGACKELNIMHRGEMLSEHFSKLPDVKIYNEG